MYRADLTSAVATYEYESCFFSCSTETTQHTLGGGVDLGLLLTFGLDFGG